jgi:acyl-CoA synthetase (AMP-forming)/AMP-acid ligase II
VVIRGPGVMAGYLDDPHANAAAFVDGWLRTMSSRRMSLTNPAIATKKPVAPARLGTLTAVKPQTAAARNILRAHPARSDALRR